MGAKWFDLEMNVPLDRLLYMYGYTKTNTQIVSRSNEFLNANLFGPAGLGYTKHTLSAIDLRSAIKDTMLFAPPPPIEEWV